VGDSIALYHLLPNFMVVVQNSGFVYELCSIDTEISTPVVLYTSLWFLMLSFARTSLVMNNVGAGLIVTRFLALSKALIIWEALTTFFGGFSIVLLIHLFGNIFAHMWLQVLSHRRRSYFLLNLTPFVIRLYRACVIIVNLCAYLGVFVMHRILCTPEGENTGQMGEGEGFSPTFDNFSWVLWFGIIFHFVMLVNTFSFYY